MAEQLDARLLELQHFERQLGIGESSGIAIVAALSHLQHGLSARVDLQHGLSGCAGGGDGFSDVMMFFKEATVAEAGRDDFVTSPHAHIDCLAG